MSPFTSCVVSGSFKQNSHGRCLSGAIFRTYNNRWIKSDKLSQIKNKYKFITIKLGVSVVTCCPTHLANIFSQYWTNNSTCDWMA